MKQLALVFILITGILFAGCSPDVSQEEYDILVAELYEVEAKIANFETEYNELAEKLSDLEEKISLLVQHEMPTPAFDLYQGNINRAVAYLESRFNTETQLLFEAQGPGGWEVCSPYEDAWVVFPPWDECKFWYMDQVHWLGDSALAWMALQSYNAEMSQILRTQLEQPGYSEYASSDLPDLLSGQRIADPDPLIQKKVYVNHLDGEYLVIGGERSSDVLSPIEDYADVMLQYSIQAWRDGDEELATAYMQQVLETWDGIGIWDAPAMINDDDGRIKNEAAVYKLALLLITVQVLDYPFPYFHQVEQRIWSNQDPATGGIRTGIKPDGSIGGGFNTETTALVLLVYDEERIDMLRKTYRIAELE